MMKLVILRKYKMKLNSSVSSWKKYQKNKFKDMLICRIPQSLNKNSLQILSSIVFYKIGKLFLVLFPQLSSFFYKRRVKSSHKLITNYAQRIRMRIENIMKRDNMKEIGKILKTLTKKFKSL